MIKNAHYIDIRLRLNSLKSSFINKCIKIINSNKTLKKKFNEIKNKIFYFVLRIAYKLSLKYIIFNIVEISNVSVLIGDILP